MHSNEHLKHSNVSSVKVPDLALSSFPSAVPHIKHLRKLHFTNIAQTKYMICKRCKRARAAYTSMYDMVVQYSSVQEEIPLC